MSDNDCIVFFNHYWLQKSEFFDRIRNSVDLIFSMNFVVEFIGNQLFNLNFFNFHLVWFFWNKAPNRSFFACNLFGWMFQDHRMFHAFSRQAVGLFWFIVLQWIKTNYQHKCFLFFKYSTHSEYILISSSSSGVDILYGFLSNIISSTFSIQYCWIIRRVYII